MIRLVELFKRDERGMTLSELLVGMVLAGVVTSILVVGMREVHRGQTYTRQDADALGALRTSMDRFEREIRQARKVYPDSTAYRVHFWVDYNRNNQQDPAERIVWEVRSDKTLVRSTGDGTERIVVREIVHRPTFGFWSGTTDTSSDPTRTTLIDVDFGAEAREGVFSPERSVRTQVRLRNAEAV